MKKLIFIIVIFLIAASPQTPLVLGELKKQVPDEITNLLYYSPCDTPLKYTIGEVNSGFGLSKDQFANIVNNTASSWNKAYGKTLLIFDLQANLSINLIFDERQSLRNQVYSIKNEVEEDKNKLAPTVEEFEKMKTDFQIRVRELNEKIRYWNEQGGAPEEEYNKLIDEQEQLKELAKRLNDIAKSLNQSAAEYNAKVDTLRQAAENYDMTVHDKPEGGIYNPALNRIEVYYGSDRNELKRILTHEMGHALGLGHSSSPNDIMYPQFSGRQSGISTEDINQLKTICQPKNKVALLQERLKIIQSNFKVLFYVFIKEINSSL